MQEFINNVVVYGKKYMKKIALLGGGVVLAGIIVVVLIIVGLFNLFSPSQVNRGETITVSSGRVGMGVPAMMAEDSSGNVVYNVKAVSSGVMMPVPVLPPASTATVSGVRQVIQNGGLDIRVENADTVAQQIASVATTNSGFVDNSNIYEISDGVKAGSMTVRVPAEKFTATMDAIKILALKVNSETVSSNDVTAQVVDLQAQVKNYQAEEQQYRDIMAKAVKIQDVLDVAARLSDVQGRIERTQGQLNYVSRQVAMSTIAVSLTAEPEVKVFGIVWRPFTVIQQAFKGMLVDFSNLINWCIVFLFTLPILLVRLAFAVLVIWVLWKIVKKVVASFVSK